MDPPKLFEGRRLVVGEVFSRLMWEDAWEEMYNVEEMHRAKLAAEWLRVDAPRVAVRAAPRGGRACFSII